MKRERRSARTITFILASTVGALIYTGCSSLGPTLQGNGDIVTEGRELAAFRSIEVEGAVDVAVTYGAKQSLDIRTDENLLDIITTEVDAEGELKISSTESYSSSEGVQVTIVVPVLEGIEVEGSSEVKVAGAQLENVSLEKFEVEIEGSGDVTVESMVAGLVSMEVEGSGEILFDDLRADSVDVEIEGSGDITLKGAAAVFEVEIEGSGDLNGSDLVVEKVDATIEGAGDIRVHATTFLRAVIEGSGSIFYKGNPTVEESVSGSGRVERM